MRVIGKKALQKRGRHRAEKWWTQTMKTRPTLPIRTAVYRCMLLISLDEIEPARKQRSSRQDIDWCESEEQSHRYAYSPEGQWILGPLLKRLT